MYFTNHLTFTEWYHYLLLFLWLIILSVGVKYFYLLENTFNPKSHNSKGVSYGKNLISLSFIIGFLMFLVWMFMPANSSFKLQYVEYIFYGLFIILIIINATISISYYSRVSGIIRLVTLSILMLIYFYSGMLGGLMIVAIFALFVIIYALYKLKKTLTIR